MKKYPSFLFFFIVSLLCMSAQLSAQKVQTTSGKTSFMSVRTVEIPGTERYSYYVGDDGKTVYHGAYTFTGQETVKHSQESDFAVNYNLSANFKDGMLNGAYSVRQSAVGRIFTRRDGWMRLDISANITATFANGAPTGTISATVNDLYGTSKLSATIKGGKYVGAFSFIKGHGTMGSQGYFKGQFTADGRLTGKWSTRDDWKEISSELEFVNDFLISRVENKTATPPAQQELARQYAAGKISESDVNARGFIVVKRRLPLRGLVDDLLFERDYLGLDKLGGYDFSDCCRDKEYYELIKHDFLSPEVFDEILRSIRTANASPKPIYRSSDGYRYIINPYYDEKEGFYYLDKHGAKLALSASQYETLIRVEDSMALAHPFAYPSEASRLYMSGDLDAAARQLMISFDRCSLERDSVKMMVQWYIPSGQYFRDYAPIVEGDPNIQAFCQRYGSGGICGEDDEWGIHCTFTDDTLHFIRRFRDQMLSAASISYVRRLAGYTLFVDSVYRRMDKLYDQYDNLHTLIWRREDASDSAPFARCFHSMRESLDSFDSKEQRILVIERLSELIGDMDSVISCHASLSSSLPQELRTRYTAAIDSFAGRFAFSSPEEFAAVCVPAVADFRTLQQLFPVIRQKRADLEKAHELLMANKQDADVLASYAEAYQIGMTYPSLSTHTEVQNYIGVLDVVAMDQQRRTSFIGLRQQKEQLNEQLLELCKTYKKCKKPYQLLYDELTHQWDDAIDNIGEMEKNIRLLESIKSKIESQEPKAVNSAMKDVKTSAEFLTALGL